MEWKVRVENTLNLIIYLLLCANILDMPKRGASVNNLIYELDDHDSGSDSGNENIQAPTSRARGKRNRGAFVQAAAKRLASIKKAHAADADCVEVIDLESSGIVDLDSSDVESIGGKINKDSDIQSQTPEITIQEVQKIPENNNRERSTRHEINVFPDPNLSLNVVDSIESEDSENAVAGCQNQLPLVTVKFRDKNIARHCRAELREFLLASFNSLPHNKDVSDTESELELNIWSHDVDKQTDMDLESQPDEAAVSEEDSGLFFADINSGGNENQELANSQFCQDDIVLTVDKEHQASPQRATRANVCFNCDGNHLLHNCPIPKNYARINQARKAMTAARVGRYHVEDEQKYGHLVAGRISGRLRHALGLKRDELPLHIYRMRLLGYPPGWLQEARIQHSAITVFVSKGLEVQDPEEEEGELCAPGSKDKFDIKKILDYPGFNVQPSKRYKEAAHKYGLPPMSETDSKMNMLASLAPNAMQAYKRKKLTLFPSGGNPEASLQGGTTDMEIASDEDPGFVFPSVPPLPDEAPPPAVPPPPPPADGAPSSPEDDLSPRAKKNSKQKQKSQSSSGKSSPSLTDLEDHKRMLLEALQSSDAPDSPADNKSDSNPPSNTASLDSPSTECNQEKNGAACSTPKEKSSTPKSVQVKHSDHGTPIQGLVDDDFQHHVKLPSNDKFAKNVSDVLNFELLPDHTGYYKSMCSVMRKVEDVLTKMHES